MLKVGLTGGIGSGKTTVAHIFEVLGIPVYYADVAARLLMEEEGELKEDIIKLFGQGSYIEGKLNQKFISSEVFVAPELLSQLNAIVHPATLEHANAWMNIQTSAYVIKEAAILFESGADKYVDKVIGVSAPLHLRIERLINRNSYTEGEIKKRMEMQMNEQEKMQRCDYIIYNDELQLLIPQVLRVHEELIKALLK